MVLGISLWKDLEGPEESRKEGLQEMKELRKSQAKKFGSTHLETESGEDFQYQHAQDLLRSSQPLPSSEGLVETNPYLRSHWQLMAAGEGETVFFRDVADERLPMFQSVALHPRAYGQP